MSARPTSLLRSLLLALPALLVAPSLLQAHCDTMDGPVVADARRALEQGDVGPVLKWIGADDEGEIRDAFARTLSVRALGPQARELADGWFFETLVRVHRAGEGAPFTGLKPSGTPVEPIVLAADRALASGSADELRALLGRAVDDGIARRFTAAAGARAHAEHSLAAGRSFVAAYVELTHWLERLEHDAATDAAHAGSAAPAHVH